MKLGRGQIKYQINKREKIQQIVGERTYDTWREVKVGTELVTVEISADLDALVNILGYRAARSKHNRSVLQGGAVMCNVIKREPIENNA